ncbi:HAD-IIA family hydrolase [Yinghuangia sp. ASG 101]|uniref:HAD-IIA family hydrolase n=1 Tax=Yinghuangia sp. ASG 101 TaxID=2896848 RepID=UPI001E35D613|nr:HAD-IIA family hydrolase [Yinghuangia sp. ASG 101]UGQ10242.1 HAD-IIA family hydrolase [Yinghuangia sp. ASG 101]
MGTPEVPAEAYDVALLDLDGVVYTGPRAVPHAPEALARAREAGMTLAFVTNNASRTPEVVAAHLTEIGVPAEPGDVVTSAQAAARLVAERFPAGSPVLAVGGDGLVAALRERGLVPVVSATAEPVAVVQGFAPGIDWALLAEASYAVAAGVPWIASNLDLTVPTERGIAPGNGALVGVVRAATGAEPVVAGKPELPLHRESMLRTGAKRPLVVGDRLDTDIAGAVAGGVDSLLVLTGVTDVRALLSAPAVSRPTFVAADLRALLGPLPRPVPVGGGWVCGGWTARVDGAEAAVEGSGDAYDGLRAVCAAVWGAADGSAVDVDRAVKTVAGLGISVRREP